MFVDVGLERERRGDIIESLFRVTPRWAGTLGSAGVESFFVVNQTQHTLFLTPLLHRISALNLLRALAYLQRKQSCQDKMHFAFSSATKQAERYYLLQS